MNWIRRCSSVHVFQQDAQLLAGSTDCMRSGHSITSAPSFSMRSTSSSSASRAESSRYASRWNSNAAVGSSVLVDQDERGARCTVQGSPALGHALDERGLAGAQFALQTDQVTTLKAASQASSNAPRLLGAAAEEIECVLIQDGHAKIIRQRQTPINPAAACPGCVLLQMAEGASSLTPQAGGIRERHLLGQPKSSRPEAVPLDAPSQALPRAAQPLQLRGVPRGG